MSNTTKQALEASLKKVMLQKPLDKITISDITSDCGISRMAFYYHFKDIMDVLEWTFRRATQELVQKSLNEEDRLGALTTYVAFVRQNRKKFERLLYSRRWVQIEGMLVEAVTVYLAQIARSKVPDRKSVV